MTVDVESQIAAYARWIEDRSGAPMRRSTTIATPAPMRAPLPETSSDDVLIEMRPNDGDEHRRVRWLALAACLVLALGGLAYLADRSASEPTAPATQPTDAPATRTATTAPLAAAGECAEELSAPGELVDPATRPASAPDGVLLPADTPVGFCAQGNLDSFAAPQRYTVWATCSGCADLRGAVALVRAGNGPTVTEDPPRDYDEIDIDGRTARFYSGDETGIANLTSYDGESPEFNFFGWGVTQDQLVDAARQYVTGDETPTIAGFELVFDDQLNALWPGLSPTDATVQITYSPVSGDPEPDRFITYIYQAGPDATVDMDAFTPGMPNATLTTINGRTAITAQTADTATVIIAASDNSVIGINGVNVPLDTLTGIELTTTTANDPRWALFTS